MSTASVAKTQLLAYLLPLLVSIPGIFITVAAKGLFFVFVPYLLVPVVVSIFLLPQLRQIWQDHASRKTLIKLTIGTTLLGALNALFLQNDSIGVLIALFLLIPWFIFAAFQTYTIQMRVRQGA